VYSEVDHREHGVDALAQLGTLGHPVGDTSYHDLLLRPRDSCGHGRLFDEEGSGHFGGAEAAQQAKCQRHLRVGGEARVTAREDQAKSVIFDFGTRRVRRLGDLVGHEQSLGPYRHVPATSEVNRTPPGDGCEPCAGVGWNPLLAPVG
jgi:hypothetical protein